MFSRWIALSGVSRGTRISRRRSLSATSAARSTSERDEPAAIADSVPIEHGQITIPPLSADPDAGAAPRSPSSNTVTQRSHRLAPTRCAQRVDRRDADLRLEQTQPVARDDELHRSLRRDERLEQPHGVRRARRAGDRHDERPRGHPRRDAARTSNVAGCISRSVQHADEERDADHAVHREERGVEPREVVRLARAMLVDAAARPRRRRQARRTSRRRVPPNVAAPTAARQATVQTCNARAIEQRARARRTPTGSE